MDKGGRVIPNIQWSALTLILVDHSGMEKMNEKCLGNDGTTDVISLQYTPIPGEKMHHYAELIINVQQAIAVGKRATTQGRRRTIVPWGECRELALYIAHGCDHLCGNNDSDRASRLCMRRRELYWLNLAHKKGLVAGLTLPLECKQGLKSSIES